MGPTMIEWLRSNYARDRRRLIAKIGRYAPLSLYDRVVQMYPHPQEISVFDSWKHLAKDWVKL